MTGNAVHVHSLRLMTVQAKVHRQILRAHRYRLLGQIAMARLAPNPIADVRGMIESDVYFRIKPEDGLPGNFLTFGSVGGEFLNFRMIGGNGHMACHTKADARNSGIRSLGYARVAVHALETVLNMNLVIERDRLHRCRLQIEIFSNGIEE